MKRNTIIAVILLIAFVLIAGFSLGYRIDGLSIAKAGRLEILVPYANSTITIDGKHSGYAHDDNGVIVYRGLAKGSHSVIVSHEERYPWATTVSTPLGSLTRITPFNIKVTSNSIIIPNGSEDYARITGVIKSQTEVTRENPALSADASIAVFVEDSIIKAQWLLDSKEVPTFFCPDTSCPNEINITPTQQKINSINFYPGRNDVIVFGTTGGVFALEVTNHKNPNFQPIISSSNPKAYIEGNLLYALEDSTLGKVILD